MLAFILIMALGVLIGSFIRRNPNLQSKVKVNKVHHLIHLVVCLLLFLLGLSIGLNKLIVSNLSYFCGQAAIISSLSILGSVLASLLVYHLFFKKGVNHEG